MEGAHMNDAGRSAIKTALNNAEDNLYRAKLQAKNDPNWTTGNGDSITDVITSYQRQRDELQAALAEVTEQV